MQSAASQGEWKGQKRGLTDIEALPNSLLLECCELNFKEVWCGVMERQVSIVVYKGRIILVSKWLAVLVSSIGLLIYLVWNFPVASCGKGLHQILFKADLTNSNFISTSILHCLQLHVSCTAHIWSRAICKWTKYLGSVMVYSCHTQQVKLRTCPTRQIRLLLLADHTWCITFSFCFRSYATWNGFMMRQGVTEEVLQSNPTLRPRRNSSLWTATALTSLLSPPDLALLMLRRAVRSVAPWSLWNPSLLSLISLSNLPVFASNPFVLWKSVVSVWFFLVWG